MGLYRSEGLPDMWAKDLRKSLDLYIYGSYFEDENGQRVNPINVRFRLEKDKVSHFIIDEDGAVIPKELKVFKV